jgi:acyl-CoA thioester hydrolase
MARTKIEFPEKFVFKTDLKIRISDINYGGHLGNDSVGSLIHEARFQFFKSLGYKDELSLEGVGAIQADMVIVYRGEAFHGDHVEIKVAVTEISKVSFDLTYLILETNSEKEIARGKTTIVTYDYAQKKKVSVPLPLVEKLRS